MNQADIPGYTYGTGAVPRSPVSLDELELLEATLLLGPDDLAALRRSADLLAPRVEEILDVWYGFVGANLQEQPFGRDVLRAFHRPASAL